MEESTAKKITRVRHSRESWSRYIQEQEQSGQSALAYCAAHGLPPKSFSYWKHRLKVQKPSFIPAIVKEEPSELTEPVDTIVQSKRICTMEFGETGRLVIESTEALLPVLEMIERRL